MKTGKLSSWIMNVLIGSGANASSISDCESNGGDCGGCLCFMGTLSTVLLLVILGIMFIADAVSEFNQQEIPVNNDNDAIIINANETNIMDECYISDIVEFPCQCQNEEDQDSNIQEQNDSYSLHECTKYIYYAVSSETCGNFTLISDGLHDENLCINTHDNETKSNMIYKYTLNHTVTCLIVDCDEHMFSFGEMMMSMDNLEAGDQDQSSLDPLTKLLIGIALLIAPYFVFCCNIVCAAYCSSHEKPVIRYDRVKHDI